MSYRRKGRSLALQGLYQIDLVQTPIGEVTTFRWFDKPITQEEKEYARSLIQGVVKNWDLIDTIISKYSRNWDLERISVVNRCILRLSIYSIVQEKSVPPGVIINEALDLAREFENEASVSFLNGILDSIYKDEQERTGEGAV